MIRLPTRSTAALLVCCALAPRPATAQTANPEAPAVTPQSSTTPDSVETRLGTLKFKDGMPSTDTLEKVYENLDFVRGVDTFMNAFQGVSLFAIRQGFRNIGVADNSVLIYSDLMDSKSVFLTANADTVYFLSFLDLTKGPVVIETPPMALGTIDDMWFRWVTDFGAPGPDRGEGGKYLILPPGYQGDLPDSGFNVAKARTTRVCMLGRSFMENNDPKPTVELIRKALKIYPYTPGGYGTSIATILEGKIPPGRIAPPPPTKFIEGSGVSVFTIPANDFRYYEQLNALVQQEPADALDPEIMGQLAAIGIVKGKPFAPDARLKQTLTDAAAVGNATARALVFRPRDPAWAYYAGSVWHNALWQGGYTFETPPPQVTRDGIKPFPPTGARTLDSRIAFFYYATGVTPAMIMRLPEIGSQYLMAFTDAAKNDLDGAKTYKVALPPKIPEAKFWSFTLYDNQTRSMLETPQRYPRAGSQSYPSPAAEPSADGSMTVYFGPSKPAGVPDGNWIQTVPGKGFNVILRLYSPLEPFFTKSWRVGEIEEVK